MQLIGMLDSPYVRRAAISLRLLGLPFEHRPISVFRQFDEFAAINPVVKAPTLVCDDGEVLMDSGLILEYAERLAAPRASLVPKGVREAQHDLRVTGLALAACEKAVQIVYETTLRPAEKQYAWWLERVRGQLGAALAALEAELVRTPLAAGRADDHAGRRHRRGGLGVRPVEAARGRSPRARIRRSWRMAPRPKRCTCFAIGRLRTPGRARLEHGAAAPHPGSRLRTRRPHGGVVAAPSTARPRTTLAKRTRATPAAAASWARTEGRPARQAEHRQNGAAAGEIDGGLHPGRSFGDRG